MCLFLSIVRRGIARPFSVKRSGTHRMHMYDAKCNCNTHDIKNADSKVTYRPGASHKNETDSVDAHCYVLNGG